MRIALRSSLLVFLLVLLAAPTSASAARAAKPKPPRPGAVKLAGALQKKVATARCGFIGVAWQPGTALRGGWFVAKTTQAGQLRAKARKARGAAKRALLKQAAAIDKQRTSQALLCAVPVGAVIVRSNAVERRNGVSCLRAGSVPGALFANGRYFASYVVQGRDLGRLVAVTKGRVRTRLQAAQRAAVSRSRSTGCRIATPIPITPLPSQTPAPLRFNLGNAAALAVTAPGSALRAAGSPGEAALGTGSNLDVVALDGSTREAVTSGAATVSKTLIAPNGATYVLFQTRVNLEDTNAIGWADGCLLAQVDATTGVPTCIDNDLMFINWGGTGMGFSQTNLPIQFDASGAIYYSGSKTDGRGVLRRYLNGVRTEVANDYISVQDFLVRPDGTVFYSGRTSTTQVNFVRRVTPGAGLSTIRNVQNNFLSVYPDDKLYMGMYDMTNGLGVYRYDIAGAAMDPTAWISADPTAHQPTTGVCGVFDPSDGFCGNNGNYVKGMYVTDSKAFAIAGTGGTQGSLMQYFPTLERPASDFKVVTLGVQAGSKLVLAGIDDADAFRIATFDTVTNTEQMLTTPGEIDVYHLDHVPSDNTVLFDGLRFTDNQYVFGSIDLGTGTVTVRAAIGERWNDFQAYG